MFSVRRDPVARPRSRPATAAATIAEAIDASGLGWRVEREPIAVDRDDAATRDDWWMPVRGDPRLLRDRPPGHPSGARDRRRALPDRPEPRGVPVRRPAPRVKRCTSRPPAACTAAAACGCSPTLPEHVEVGGDPVRPVRAADEQPRRLDRRDRRDHPDQGRLPEHTQLGIRQGAQKFSIRHTEQISRRVHEARRVLDLSIDYYQQFKTTGDQLAVRALHRDGSSRRCSTSSTPRHPGRDRPRTQELAEQTKQRIVELFLRGDTQGTRPAASGRP